MIPEMIRVALVYPSFTGRGVTREKVKAEEQQSALTMHRVRELLVRQRKIVPPRAWLGQ